MYFILWIPRTCLRKKSVKLNNNNLEEMLKKGQKWFGIENKNIQVRFAFQSISYYDEKDKKYQVTISHFSKRYLTLIHELHHIYRGDCDNHNNENIFFTVKLAFRYVFLYEFRTVMYEMTNWKKFV